MLNNDFKGYTKTLTVWVFLNSLSKPVRLKSKPPIDKNPEYNELLVVSRSFCRV